MRYSNFNCFHSFNCPPFLRNIFIMIKTVTTAGINITAKKKLAGSLHVSEIVIIEADTIISAKPTAVNRLAHLLCIRTRTDDDENGTRSIPTAITIAI